MRIISGLFKGKNISYLKSKKTRPLKDSVRENIFNIISHSNLLNINLKKSNILDLYSGIGSFGIECISRGVKKVTFVEQDIEASQILERNLVNLEIREKANVFNEQVKKFLDKKLSKFDLIFFDPPFADSHFLEELRLIKEKGIFTPNHSVIIHREKKTVDNFNNILDLLVIKNYGRSKIIFAKFLT